MMHPGIVGALALIGTAGAIYFGSGYLNDYFAARNADTAVETAAQSEDATSAPSSLVGDTAEMPAEAAETAMDEVAALTDDVADAATDMADTAQEVVEETAQETLERVLEAAPREETAAGELEAAPEPGTTPVLDIVRIEPSGEAVIAGNAPQGERVGLLYNNELIADTTVDAGGDFVLIPDEPLPSGEGTMEIVVIDEAGNTVIPSQEQVAVVLPEDGSADGFLVGVLRPNQPVDIIERQAPVASSGADAPEIEVAARVEPAAAPDTSEPTQMTQSASDITPESADVPEVEVATRVEPTQPVEPESAQSDQAASPEAFVVVDAIELEGNEIWIAGGALPGTVIRLYQDNTFLGEAITGDEGRYLFEGTLLDADGNVTVRADALVSGSADVIARAEVPFEMPMTSAQIAAAALEQAQEAAPDIADASNVAEIAQEQAETALASVSDAAQSVADTASDAVEAAQEDVAEAVSTAVQTAVETAAQAVDTSSEQTADAPDVLETEQAAETSETTAAPVETAQVETPGAVQEDTAQGVAQDVAQGVTQDTAQDVVSEVEQATNVAAPQADNAVTTTPGTPPTEALAQALADNATETAASDSQTPTAPAAAEVAATTPAVVAPAVAAPAVVAPAASAQPERISVLNTGQVIIRRGDNLWRLSRRVYGQGIRYTSIYDANRDQIGQPELIFPGQVFTLPTPQEEWGSVPGLEALEADQIPGDGVETQ